MEVINAFAQGGLDYALLLFLRVSGITLSSPIFGRTAIPAQAKIIFSLALAYFFFTLAPLPAAQLAYANIVVFVLVCMKEMLIGLVMGYLLTLFFDVALVAGQLIDMQMGFGMANVFDEQSNASIPMLGNLLNLMMMLVFIAVGGFERLIAMMALTFEAMPVGTIQLSGDIAFAAAELFAEAFLLGVRMALPVIVAGLLGEAIMGVLVRTIPQMNVFVLGLPLKVLLGLLILLITMPMYVALTDTVFERMFAGMERMFDTLRGG